MRWRIGDYESTAQSQMTKQNGSPRDVWKERKHLKKETVSPLISFSLQLLLAKSCSIPFQLCAECLFVLLVPGSSRRISQPVGRPLHHILPFDRPGAVSVASREPTGFGPACCSRLRLHK